MTIDEIIKDSDQRMHKTVDVIKSELAKIRTGRASASMLDGITINYYGNQTPLNQVANINIPEPRLITISPWDRSQTPEIEKAILASDLGITPNNDGNMIRLKIPELTEERRNDLVKVAKKYGEEGKVSIRNIRRDSNDAIKKMQKNSDISEDEASVHHDTIQELTDKFTAEIDKIVKVKEDDLLKV
ncbi:MAG: ribosome recycling factor [Calditrichaeota bacterium]|nr:ribosome recycling factor [Calditrichota bacterium]